MKPKPGIYSTMTSVICVTINMIFYGLPVHHKVLKVMQGIVSITLLWSLLTLSPLCKFIAISRTILSDSHHAIIYTCTGLQVLQLVSNMYL